MSRPTFVVAQLLLQLIYFANVIRASTTLMNLRSEDNGQVSRIPQKVVLQDSTAVELQLTSRTSTLRRYTNPTSSTLWVYLAEFPSIDSVTRRRPLACFERMTMRLCLVLL